MAPKPSVIATVINDVVYDQRMIRICTSLSSAYDVSLWGRKKSDIATEERPYLQRRFRFLVQRGPLFYLVYNLRIFVALLFTRFDIVHAVDLDTLPAGYWAAKLKGKKLVYDSHEYFTEVPELVSRPLKRKLWLMIESRILPKVKNAITVGEMIAKEYENKYDVHFCVIKNCPYLKEDTEYEVADTKYLVYQGALNKGRGLEVLIEAMQYIDMPLRIAGKGDIEDHLKELVMRYKVEEKVTFLGLLKPSELPSLTHNAFAGINVSENLGLSYYYSLNNKFFDHVHSVIPSITNPFPEYKQLSEQYEVTTWAESKVDDLVKAVTFLSSNPNEYAKFKKNCLLARKEWNWQQEEKKLLDFYQHIE